MEVCQICQLLWCALLLQGAAINVWASGETPEATPSHTPGAPLETVNERQDTESLSVNSTNMVSSPPDDSNPTHIPNLPGPAPSSAIPAPSSAIPAPSDITGCFRWAEWQTIVLVGGAVLVFALLVSTVTLAHRVRHLQRQVHGGRPTRTNVDLVSGMGYPSSSRGGSREMVSSGPAEASLKMEEVTQTQEGKEVGGEEETAEVGSQQRTAGKEGDSGNGEASRESSAHTGPAKEEVEVLVVV